MKDEVPLDVAHEIDKTDSFPGMKVLQLLKYQAVLTLFRHYLYYNASATVILLYKQVDRYHSKLKGELSPQNMCGLYDRASPEKCFGVSLAYVRSLEGSQKAG